MANDLRNLMVVVLDSLRYDSWVKAAPRELGRLGSVERRWSYATWTAPSHYNLLSGLLPHESPPNVLASDYYKRDFARYAERLGAPDINFGSMLPGLWLPTFLRSRGYRTVARVSMPVLNEATLISTGFDDYALMPRHNDMASMLLTTNLVEEPFFCMLNVGETHYPYALPDEDPSRWPRVSGLHGVLRHLDEPAAEEVHFTDTEFKEMHERQINAVTYLDQVFATLFDALPDNTWVVVTADHGELFGEDGYFGHGPIMHPKVLEVPFVEGPVPR
ncbi:MAG TPA: sulfatase-like hydrolase/transferase [Mycobacteriales bacterium]|nr:sulfatase-like hydrolase/transferase [Mycobacteriales bacterium]